MTLPKVYVFRQVVELPALNGTARRPVDRVEVSDYDVRELADGFIRFRQKHGAQYADVSPHLIATRIGHIVDVVEEPKPGAPAAAARARA